MPLSPPRKTILFGPCSLSSSAGSQNSIDDVLLEKDSDKPECSQLLQDEASLPQHQTLSVPPTTPKSTPVKSAFPFGSLPDVFPTTPQEQSVAPGKPQLKRPPGATTSFRRRRRRRIRQDSMFELKADDYDGNRPSNPRSTVPDPLSQLHNKAQRDGKAHSSGSIWGTA